MKLEHLPGRVRVVIVFGLIGPLAASVHIGWQTILDKDLLSIVGSWLALAAAFMTLAYAILFIGRLLLWVQQGFEVGSRNEMARALLRTFQVIVVLAVILVFALYTRYDVVAVMDQSEAGYRFLVWDRWTGEMTLQYGELKPSLRKFRRL